MKSVLPAAIAVLAVSVLTLQSADARVLRGWRYNAAGGVTAGSVHNRFGPNGGRIVGRRGIATDGQGGFAAGGVNCASGAAGRGCRAGYTTRSDDGTLTHKSGAVVQGAGGGSATTSGGFTRNPDGSYSGGRTTDITTAQGSRDAQTTYDSATGVTRTVTCSDASGASIACPTR